MTPPLPASLATMAAADRGCAYILDPEERGGRRRCAAPRQRGSSYCSYHHARCHLVPGSAAEAARFREIELLAETVGGRRAPKATRPPARFLDRLEALSRNFS
jgi:hypothetical protein